MEESKKCHAAPCESRCSSARQIEWLLNRIEQWHAKESDELFRLEVDRRYADAAMRSQYAQALRDVIKLAKHARANQ